MNTQTLNQELDTDLAIAMLNALMILNGYKVLQTVRIGYQVLMTLIQEKDIMVHAVLNWTFGKQTLNQHN